MVNVWLGIRGVWNPRLFYVQGEEGGNGGVNEMELSLYCKIEIFKRFLI